MDLKQLLLVYDFKGLPPTMVKQISFQLVKALQFSASLNIIHADVKPENVMFSSNARSNLTLIDWGSGAFVNQTVYQYVQQRFYRAPEVILGMPYGTEIDTWSLGCVLFEIFTGKTLFQSDSEADQIGRICEVLGYPPLEMLNKAPRKQEFFWNVSNDAVRLRTNHLVAKKKLSLLLKAAGRDFVEVVQKMLQWEPEKRITMEEVLKMRFFEEDQKANVQTETMSIMQSEFK